MEKRILVVEDETGIADNIVYALRTEGFSVTCCPTGHEAREILLAGGDVDLVVLDIGLPDMSGFDLCTEIRRRFDVPVIFLTARSDEIDRVAGLEMGGDDYVVKPFSPRELAARVRAVMRRAAGREGTVRGGTAPPLDIDRKRFTARYCGIPLELSRYEFRILETLAGRPGWVFSREQLIQASSEEPDASLDRTVDSHIKNIRAKLRAVRPDVDPIRTHRGLGYSLRESW